MFLTVTVCTYIKPYWNFSVKIIVRQYISPKFARNMQISSLFWFLRKEILFYKLFFQAGIIGEFIFFQETKPWKPKSKGNLAQELITDSEWITTGLTKNKDFLSEIETFLIVFQISEYNSMRTLNILWCG